MAACALRALAEVLAGRAGAVGRAGRAAAADGLRFCSADTEIPELLHSDPVDDAGTRGADAGKQAEADVAGAGSYHTAVVESGGAGAGAAELVVAVPDSCGAAGGRTVKGLPCKRKMAHGGLCPQHGGPTSSKSQRQDVQPAKCDAPGRPATSKKSKGKNKDDISDIDDGVPIVPRYPPARREYDVPITWSMPVEDVHSRMLQIPTGTSDLARPQDIAVLDAIPDHLRLGVQREPRPPPPPPERIRVKPDARAAECVAVTVTEAERKAGKVEPSKLEVVAEQFATYGHVTVGGVLELRTVDALTLEYRMCHDALYHWIEGSEKSRGSLGAGGHLQLGLPRTAPWVYPEVVCNPVVEQIAAALLPGDTARLAFCNGNSALPGCGTQPLHMDGEWAWKTPAEAASVGQPWPPPATSVVVNIGTQWKSIYEEAGPTELWPGSHTNIATARYPGRVARESFEIDFAGEIARQRDEQPPVLNLLPKGAASFRDPRLWHRGTPNRGTMPRHMLALVYESELTANLDLCRPRSGNVRDGKMVFSSSVRSVFSEDSRWGVDRNIAFADGRVDHFGNIENTGDAKSLSSSTSDPREHFCIPAGPHYVPLYPEDIPEWVNACLPLWIFVDLLPPELRDRSRRPIFRGRP